MRRSSIGFRGAPPLEPIDEVILRSKIPGPALGPGFMRRSCTFVTEGSWRKNSFGIGSAQKENKDRANLALQVRKKAAQLGNGCDGGDINSSAINGRSGGRVSRLVGNLKSWSSSEDVRHSVVGALTRTVNVIKHGPSTKKEKQTTTERPLYSQPFKTPCGVVPSTVTAKDRKKGVPPPVSTPSAKSNPRSNKAPKAQHKKTPLPKKRGTPVSQGDRVKPAIVSHPEANKNTSKTNKPWLRHLHEAQANYNAKEGRNRRSQPPPNLAESDEGSSAPADLKDVDDGVDGDNSESTNSTSENVSSRGKQENLEGGSVPHSAAPGTTSPETISNKTESGYTTAVSVPGSEASGPGTQPPAQGLSSPSGGPRRRLQEVQIIQIVEGPSLIQPSEVTVSQGVVLSAEPVLTPLELLRRKDLKIREELAEKQDLVADILNIPRRDFESVADVAGEAGLANKEPRELVLGAIFQAKRLQETLNETQNLREGAIIASHASLVDGGGGGSTPAYQTSFETMDKLLSISGALTQFLNSLMVLVSERDEERERMRRELVSSRDRVHQLHMQQQQNSNVEPTTATPSTVQPQNGSSSDLPEATSTLPVLEMVTPNSSRPSSFVYNNSFTTEHSESADLTNIEREDKYIEPVKSVAPEVTLPSDTPTTDSEKRNSGDVTGLSVSGGEDVGAVFGVKAPPNPPPEDSTNPPVEETKEGVVAT